MRVFKDLKRAFHSRIKKSIAANAQTMAAEKDKLCHNLIDNNNNNNDDSSWEEERSWLEARRQKLLARTKPFDMPQQQADEGRDLNSTP